MAERSATLRGRARLRRAQVPPALAALLAVSLVLGVLWANLTPAFQTPDEQSHFAYAQQLAETFELPGKPAEIYSTEHIYSAYMMNADHVAYQPQVKPEWSERLYGTWKRTVAGDPRSNGGGPHSAAANPPLAYLWEAGGYTLAGGDFFDRLTAVRVASALWLLVTVLGTWLLAGELLGRDRLLQLVAASVPALLPMVGFISASAGVDGMLYGLWALALWLGVRILRRGLTLWPGVALGLIVGAACVTKATSYALLPALVIAVVVGMRRSGAGAALAGRVPRALAALAPAVAIVAAWFLLARSLDRAPVSQLTGATTESGATNWRELFSYMWQYYLPPLPGQERFAFNQPGYSLFQVWIKQGWGAFGWLEVRFPDPVYRVLAVLTAGAGAGALAALWRARRRLDWAIAAYLGVAALALLAGLHWTDYRFIKGGHAFIQGRYLFPLLPILAAGLAAAVGLSGARRRRPLAGGLVAFLFVFHVACVGLVVERFYA